MIDWQALAKSGEGAIGGLLQAVDAKTKELRGPDVGGFQLPDLGAAAGAVGDTLGKVFAKPEATPEQRQALSSGQIGNYVTPETRVDGGDMMQWFQKDMHEIQTAKDEGNWPEAFKVATRSLLGLANTGAVADSQLMRNILGTAVTTLYDDPDLRQIKDTQGPDAAFDAYYTKNFDPQDGRWKDSWFGQIAQQPVIKGFLEGSAVGLPAAAAVAPLRGLEAASAGGRAAEVATGLRRAAQIADVATSGPAFGAVQAADYLGRGMNPALSVAGATIGGALAQGQGENDHTLEGALIGAALPHAGRVLSALPARERGELRIPGMGQEMPDLTGALPPEPPKTGDLAAAEAGGGPALGSVVEGAAQRTGEAPEAIVRQATDIAQAEGRVVPEPQDVAKVVSGEPATPPEAPRVAPTTAEATYTHDSTQFDLPEPQAARVLEEQKRIDPADITGDGYEVQPHITAVYGTKATPEELRAALADTAPIKVELGSTEAFPAKEGAVPIYAKVEDNPELKALQAKLQDLGLVEGATRYPEYTPHVTLAYVKPEAAVKYAGKPWLSGTTFTVDHLTFSTKDGQKIDIPLGGRPYDAPAAVSAPHQSLPAVVGQSAVPDAGGGAIRADNPAVPQAPPPTGADAARLAPEPPVATETAGPTAPTGGTSVAPPGGVPPVGPPTGVAGPAPAPDAKQLFHIIPTGYHYLTPEIAADVTEVVNNAAKWQSQSHEVTLARAQEMIGEPAEKLAAQWGSADMKAPAEALKAIILTMDDYTAKMRALGDDLKAGLISAEDYEAQRADYGIRIGKLAAAARNMGSGAGFALNSLQIGVQMKNAMNAAIKHEAIAKDLGEDAGKLKRLINRAARGLPVDEEGLALLDRLKEKFEARVGRKMTEPEMRLLDATLNGEGEDWVPRGRNRALGGGKASEREARVKAKTGDGGILESDAGEVIRDEHPDLARQIVVLDVKMVLAEDQNELRALKMQKDSVLDQLKAEMMAKDAEEAAAPKPDKVTKGEAAYKALAKQQRAKVYREITKEKKKAQHYYDLGAGFWVKGLNELDKLVEAALGFPKQQQRALDAAKLAKMRQDAAAARRAVGKDYQDLLYWSDKEIAAEDKVARTLFNKRLDELDQAEFEQMRQAAAAERAKTGAAYDEQIKKPLDELAAADAEAAKNWNEKIKWGRIVAEQRAAILRAREIGMPKADIDRLIAEHDAMVTNLEKEIVGKIRERLAKEKATPNTPLDEKVLRSAATGVERSALMRLQKELIGPPDRTVRDLVKPLLIDPRKDDAKAAIDAIDRIREAAPGSNLQKEVLALMKQIEDMSAYHYDLMQGYKERFARAQLKRIYTTQEIDQFTDERRRLVEEIDWTDPRAAGILARAASEPSVYHQLMAIRAASLLSGVSTQMVNFIGNSLMVAGAPIGRAGAALGEEITTLGGRRRMREAEWGDVAAEISGMQGAFKDALKDLQLTWETGVSTRQMRDLRSAYSGQITWPIVGSGSGPYNPLNLNNVFRAMGAVDDFFRTLNFGGALAVEVERQARKMRQAGESMEAARVRAREEMLSHPEMIERASADSERRTFQQRLGKNSQALSSLRSSPAVAFLMPFFATSANIMRIGFDLTPVGFYRAERYRRAGDLVAAANARGEAMLGSASMLAFGLMAADGSLSGSGPSDDNQRRMLLEQGWQPYSVRVGNQWVPYMNLGPMAIPMAFSATLVEAVKEGAVAEDKANAVLSKFIMDFGKVWLQMSAMTGLQSAFQAIQDPERYGESFIQSMVTSLVPYRGFMAQFARALDPEIKKPDNVLEAILAIIPFASEMVPGDVTAVGTPRIRQGGPLAAFSPFRVTEAQPNPLYEELARLNSPLTKPSRYVGDGELKKTLTGVEYEAYQTKAGENTQTALNALMGTEVYTNATDAEKKQMVDFWKGYARRAAREDLGLSPLLPEDKSPLKYRGVQDKALEKEIDDSLAAYSSWAAGTTGAGIPTERQLQLVLAYGDRDLLRPEYLAAQEAKKRADEAAKAEVAAAIKPPEPATGEQQQSLQRARQVQQQIDALPLYLIPNSTPDQWKQWDSIVSRWNALPNGSALKEQYRPQVEALEMRKNPVILQQQMASEDYQRWFGIGKNLDQETWAKLQQLPKYTVPNSTRAQWAAWDAWLAAWNRLPTKSPLRIQNAVMAKRLRNAINPAYKRLVPEHEFTQLFGADEGGQQAAA